MTLKAWRNLLYKIMTMAGFIALATVMAGAIPLPDKGL